MGPNGRRHHAGEPRTTASIGTLRMAGLGPLSSVRRREHTRRNVTDIDAPTTAGRSERMTRRRLLTLGALTGGGLVATAVAACTTPASTTGWTLGPALGAAPAAPACGPSPPPVPPTGWPPGPALGAAPPPRPPPPPAAPASVAPSVPGSHDPSHAPAASSGPPADHDAHAKAAVDRF